MIRQVVLITALLAAAVAVAQPKGSEAGTPAAGGSPATPTATPEKAATPAPGRSEAARKALGALKGANDKDKRGKDERKPGGR